VREKNRWIIFVEASSYLYKLLIYGGTWLGYEVKQGRRRKPYGAREANSSASAVVETGTG
jgi:hypothetical protein